MTNIPEASDTVTQKTPESVRRTHALPRADADALETLYEAMMRTTHAFTAVQRRMGGKVQRAGPGVWLVTTDGEP